MCTFDYPEHYNYLTKDQQESVLSWFNTTKDIERSIISTSVKSKSERELKAFSENRERYERMRQTGNIAPLRASCPNCPWFEPKYRPCDTWFNRDCMRDWQGCPVVTCRAMI